MGKEAYDSSSERMNVLMVDDDLNDQHAFAEIIGRLDLPADIIYCSDSEELFASLEKDRNVHLILLDINIPGLNGRECLKMLKAHKQYKHIPVVIFTVSINPWDIEDTFRSGAHYYVVKPYAPVNMLQAIKVVFSVRWSQSQPHPAKDDYVINRAFTG